MSYYNTLYTVPPVYMSYYNTLYTVTPCIYVIL